jgi:hypothetical protein
MYFKLALIRPVVPAISQNLFYGPQSTAHGLAYGLGLNEFIPWLISLGPRGAAQRIADFSIFFKKKQSSGEKNHAHRRGILVVSQLQLCLVPSKFQKFYNILRHIKSLNACMEH